MTPLVAHLARGLAPLGPELARESASNIACAVECGMYIDDADLAESVSRSLTTARLRGLPAPTEEQLRAAHHGVAEAIATWHGDWCDRAGCRSSVDVPADRPDMSEETMR